MRRSRQHAEPSQGQDYLASVSDLMSGLIFIFIITLAVFSLRLARTQKVLTDSREVREGILKDLKRELDEAGIDVTVDLEHGVLSLTDSAVRFDRGAADPVLEHQPHVGEVASVLLEVLPRYVDLCAVSEMPENSSSRPAFCAPNGTLLTAEECASGDEGPRVETVLIEGHTDSVPIGPGFRYRDNLELSAARSAQVLRMMNDCEPALGSLRNRSGMSVVSVSGYGATRPADADTEAARNRRIDLRFLMELPDGEEPQPVTETREGLSQ
jgi:chemotaxis protein MotB